MLSSLLVNQVLHRSIGLPDLRVEVLGHEFGLHEHLAGCNVLEVPRRTRLQNSTSVRVRGRIELLVIILGLLAAPDIRFEWVLRGKRDVRRVGANIIGVCARELRCKEPV